MWKKLRSTSRQDRVIPFSVWLNKTKHDNNNNNNNKTEPIFRFHFRIQNGEK